MITQQPTAQRIAGGVLDLAIERGANPQPAGIDAVGPVLGLFAVFLDQDAADFLEIVTGIGALDVGAPAHQAERLGLGGGDFFARRPAIALHPVEDGRAPLQREVFIARATIAFGRLGKNREECRLV